MRKTKQLSERTPGRRPGFTLVELMVAMTLTLFIMVVLTQAFVTSLATFSGLKSIGELQANLRTVSQLLQADLALDHFEGDRRLSSPDLLTLPPRQGFFYIYQGTGYSPAATGNYTNMDEGNESTSPSPGLESYRATNHVLYFTVRLRGNRPDSFMFATLPNGSPLLGSGTTFFNQPLDAMYIQPGSNTSFIPSQWAEVCYFLVQTGQTTDPANPGVEMPLYSLYRSQYLLVLNPPSTGVVWPPQPGAPFPTPPYPYANVSGRMVTPNTATANLIFNSPDDVATPANRTLTATSTPPIRASDNTAALGSAPSYPSLPTGSTLVLSNVTSFQVQVFTQPFGSTSPPPGSDFTDVSGTYPAIYDSSTPANNPFNILGVKINIRIWDSSSQLSRQVTVIQDM
jgi:prepilin-type N-terminal cleavage/methylation domain-containing protein